MKTNQWQSKFSGAILVFSFVFGIALLSVTVQAQTPDDRYAQDRGRNWDHYGNYGGSFECGKPR